MPQVFEQSLFLFVTKTLHIKNIPSGALRQTPLGAVLILKKRGGGVKRRTESVLCIFGAPKIDIFKEKSWTPCLGVV